MNPNMILSILSVLPTLHFIILILSFQWFYDTAIFTKLYLSPNNKELLLGKIKTARSVTVIANGLPTAWGKSEV
jgi:hypothetical protein